MLALRARGMGSVWTTMTCRKADEVAAVLGVPADYTHIGMFPVAYTIGTDFKPAPRVDPQGVIHWNRWQGMSEPASPTPATYLPAVSSLRYAPLTGAWVDGPRWTGKARGYG